MYCLLWLFLAAYRDKRGRDRTRQLIAYGAVLAMTMWLFHMADSMTSMSCFLMAGSFLAVMSLVKVARKPAVVHLMVAVIVGVSFCPVPAYWRGCCPSENGKEPNAYGSD